MMRALMLVRRAAALTGIGVALVGIIGYRVGHRWVERMEQTPYCEPDPTVRVVVEGLNDVLVDYARTATALGDEYAWWFQVAESR